MTYSIIFFPFVVVGVEIRVMSKNNSQPVIYNQSKIIRRYHKKIYHRYVINIYHFVPFFKKTYIHIFGPLKAKSIYLNMYFKYLLKLMTCKLQFTIFKTCGRAKIKISLELKKELKQYFETNCIILHYSVFLSSSWSLK